ncbi:hypothetical protein EDB85DRAFT_2223765 [Lactarius pseudohatsudake]|nr:hypothetical protein EDB85DRAFT_2223765 [Lactarius pseudohatsudake]
MSFSGRRGHPPHLPRRGAPPDFSTCVPRPGSLPTLSSTNYYLTTLNGMVSPPVDNANIDPELLPGSEALSQQLEDSQDHEQHWRLWASSSPADPTERTRVCSNGVGGIGPIRNGQGSGRRSRSAYSLRLHASPLIRLPIPFTNSDPPDSQVPHLPATFESLLQNANSSPNYTGLKVTQLKELCRSRSLTRGGKKTDLVHCLQEYDASQVPTASANTSSSISRGSCGADSSHSQSALESAIAHDVDELCSSFDRGLFGKVDKDDSDDGGDDPMVGEADDSDNPGANGTTSSQSAAAGSGTAGAKAWVDRFILDSRRKSGQQTEKSVLSLWQVRA